MSNFRIFLSIVSAIVLFLYGLGAFSQEIRTVGCETLKKWLGRLTENIWLGVLSSAVATAIVQSSSAVTALTVALVDAGTISFRSSLGVVLRSEYRNELDGLAGFLEVDGDRPIFHCLWHTA
jgi:phosphate:Na+ symporter